MRPAPGTDAVTFLLSLPAEARGRKVKLLGLELAEALDRGWRLWAHDGQRPPHDDWRVWVMMAGRGFGKTLAGAQWASEAIRSTPDMRIALVGATLEEARRVMVEGPSGLLRIAALEVERWSPTRGVLRFKNGAEATLFSGCSPEKLRGPEHHIAWCDELAKWERPGETWDMLQLGLRLGERPRALVTTTPRPGPVLRRIMAEPGCVTTGGRTRDNPHIAPAFKETVERLYGGTRLGAQELEGQLLPEGGALWTPEVIERCRPSGSGPAAGGFLRVVVGVDPPAGDGTCGIVACARDAGGLLHVLADHSVTARSPEGWARAVADAAAAHGTTQVVAERNQGGRMVEAVLRAAGPRLSVKPVHASDGKATRAEPIALLFEAGRVRLHARFAELEAELMGMVAGAPYQGPGTSPDRADAMVWALTELMTERAMPGVRWM
ncbi:MAG TPA: terminase family protein [Sphingomonas sp.]|jgi:phage terminase large subunit-like protein